MKQITLKLTVIGLLFLIIVSGINTSLSKNIKSRSVNNASQNSSDLEYLPEEEKEAGE